MLLDGEKGSNFQVAQDFIMMLFLTPGVCYTSYSVILAAALQFKENAYH